MGIQSQPLMTNDSGQQITSNTLLKHKVSDYGKVEYSRLLQESEDEDGEEGKGKNFVTATFDGKTSNATNLMVDGSKNIKTDSQRPDSKGMTEVVGQQADSIFDHKNEHLANFNSTGPNFNDTHF